MAADTEQLIRVIAQAMNDPTRAIELPDGRRHVALDLNISYVQEALNYPYDDGFLDRVLCAFGEWFIRCDWRLVYIQVTKPAVPGLIAKELLLLINNKPTVLWGAFSLLDLFNGIGDA